MNKNRNQSNISDIIQINDEIIESLTIANNLPNNQRNDRTMLNQSKDFGVRYYSNGAIYIGQFKDDKCNGYGKYKQENDDIIVGIFHNNYLHEYGIIERKNTNSIYETKWKFYFSNYDGISPNLFYIIFYNGRINFSRLFIGSNIKLIFSGSFELSNFGQKICSFFAFLVFFPISNKYFFFFA